MLLEWKKVNDSTRLAFIGKWHLFTFIEDSMGGYLLPQFFGYETEGITDIQKIKCNGGFLQAKKEAQKIIDIFLTEVIVNEKN